MLLRLETVSAAEPEALTVADATLASETELLAVVLTRLVVSTVPGIVIAEPETLLSVRVAESEDPLTAESCHAKDAPADVLLSFRVGAVLPIFCTASVAVEPVPSILVYPDEPDRSIVEVVWPVTAVDDS